LLYARFFTKALGDCGYTSVREPFKRLLCQGMVCMETYYREDGTGKKQYFYPDEVTVEKNDKGKVITAIAKADGNSVIVGRVEKMSKSKRNTVDPQLLIDAYGADTARLFALFAAPPELDLEWNEAGVLGAHRFLKRVWALAQEHKDHLANVAPFAGHVTEVTGADQAFVRKVHSTVKRATDAMEKDFSFNTTIAACMELSNELKPDSLRPDIAKLGLVTLIRLLAPMVPHIAAELWRDLTGSDDVVAAGWPTYDETQIATDDVEYPVQINGKVRGKVTLSRALTGAELDAAVSANAQVQALIDGKTLRKLIVVHGKIINIVA